MLNLRWVFLILVFIATPSFSKESGPKEPSNKAETTQAKDDRCVESQQFRQQSPARNSTQTPPAIVEINSDKDTNLKGNCAENGNWKEWFKAYLFWFFDLLTAERVIALFTIILGIATWKLWKSTDRLVEGAEDTARRQLRAYILVDSVAFVFPLEDHSKAYVNILIKNFGTRPCYKGVVRLQCEVWQTKLPDFVIPLTNDAEVHSNVIVAGGHTQTINIDRSAEVAGKGQWEALKRAGKSAYVWGRIDYEDAFGIPRFTTFQLHCPFYGAYNFAISKNGNDAD